MTDYERQQIYELRMKGLGYKAIGNILGLTRDSVRSFCKRNNLVGNGKVVSLNVKIMKEENLLCLNCGKLLNSKERVGLNTAQMNVEGQVEEQSR